MQYFSNHSKNKSDAISGSGEQPAAPGLYYLASFPTNRDVSGSFSDGTAFIQGVLSDTKISISPILLEMTDLQVASGYRFGDFFSVLVSEYFI